MAILHNKFIFLHMMKTGGYSVRAFMETNIPEVIFLNGYEHIAIARLDSFIGDKVTFGFVRNPFDWYVSFWAAHWKDKLDFDSFIHLNAWEMAPKIWKPYLPSDTQDGYWSLRFLAQHFNRHAYARKEPRITTDHIFKMEDGIPHCIDLVFNRHIFKLNKKQRENLYSMQKLNTSEHKPYQEYYTEDTKALIEKKDGRLIKQLGYAFQ